jgi:hypothetical protein
VELDRSTGDKLANGDLNLEETWTRIFPDTAASPSLGDILSDHPRKSWDGPGSSSASTWSDGTFVVSGPGIAGFMTLRYKFETPVECVAFSSNGSSVLASDGKKMVHLINIPAGKERIVYEAGRAIDKLEFSAEETQGTVRINGGEVHSIVLPDMFK